jgi:hypothetical protein
MPGAAWCWCASPRRTLNIFIGLLLFFFSSSSSLVGGGGVVI